MCPRSTCAPQVPRPSAAGAGAGADTSKSSAVSTEEDVPSAAGAAAGADTSKSSTVSTEEDVPSAAGAGADADAEGIDIRPVLPGRDEPCICFTPDDRYKCHRCIIREAYGVETNRRSFPRPVPKPSRVRPRDEDVDSEEDNLPRRSRRIAHKAPRLV